MRTSTVINCTKSFVFHLQSFPKHSHTGQINSVVKGLESYRRWQYIGVNLVALLLFIKYVMFHCSVWSHVKGILFLAYSKLSFRTRKLFAAGAALSSLADRATRVFGGPICIVTAGCKYASQVCRSWRLNSSFLRRWIIAPSPQLKCCCHPCSAGRSMPSLLGC
jgi:hypothetical protein